ncbi:hypothetical protein TIFTF001_005151 [Ficus carica]|uniref:EF-hand domain-containing protein n=1 Tax=Ficus carica TaxID=3494 RepID=A0AA88A6S7_FICCA|nr:hypothetical protein TIFTF001_005151 [Ficus carica]
MVFNFQPNVRTKEICGPLPVTTEELTQIFKSYDYDHDGQLSKEELRAAFKHLGSHFARYRTAVACHYADANNDGLINLENAELSILVKYAHSCGYTVKV